MKAIGFIKERFLIYWYRRGHQKYSREVYRKKIMKLVEASAFSFMNNQKEGMTKLSGIQYDKLGIQNHLKSPEFSIEEQNLLYSLRSRSHAAKLNYRKIHSSNLKYTLGFKNDEDQFHIFQQCEALKSNTYKDVYENIFK